MLKLALASSNSPLPPAPGRIFGIKNGSNSDQRTCNSHLSHSHCYPFPWRHRLNVFRTLYPPEFHSIPRRTGIFSLSSPDRIKGSAFCLKNPPRASLRTFWLHPWRCCCRREILQEPALVPAVFSQSHPCPSLSARNPREKFSPLHF